MRSKYFLYDRLARTLQRHGSTNPLILRTVTNHNPGFWMCNIMTKRGLILYKPALVIRTTDFRRWNDLSHTQKI